MKPHASLAAAAALFSALSFVLLLAGCGQPNAQGGPPQAPPVSVAPAIQKQVQELDDFTGRLEASETVEIRARVGGTLTHVHFQAGQEVKKGQLLFTIDARPFQAELARAEAQLTGASTQAELAQQELARAQKLLDIKAISQQEFDQLTSGNRSADANVRAAQAAAQAARLNVEYASIRAPIAGRVSRANITAGNLVAAGDPILTTVVSLDKVYAYFDGSEQTYLKYVKMAREGTRPSGRTNPNPVLMGLADEQGYPHKGTIDFVDNRLNPQTGSIRARAVFDNSKREFTPGLFARLRMIGSGSYTAVLTPDRAIGTDQNKRFVLVVGADNTAQFREVKLGALIDGMRVVTGVNAGELVVVNGLQRVQPGMPVTPEKLDVDANGMPIEKPAPPQQQQQQGGDSKETKKDAKKG